MPKNRRQAGSSKFRIGTRKSGTSALHMSDDELINIACKKGKYRNNAIAVLNMRGIDYVCDNGNVSS